MTPLTLDQARQVLADFAKDGVVCWDMREQEAARVVLAALEQADSAYRMYVWLNHGHTGQYGDDGEMQCGECMRLGFYDYKREPLEKIQAGLHQLGLERIAAAFEAARVFEREE